MTTKAFISAISAAVIAVGVLVGVILTSALRPPPAPTSDKNAPGVVRVSVIQGSAVVQRGNSDVQTNAVRNAPLLPGDYISTGKTSRAELQFDGYTAVRLGGDVQARIVNDDRNSRRLQLARGTIGIGVVHSGPLMQVDTPSISVRAGRAGDSRISIAADGSSWVTARRGSVDVATPQRTYTLSSGNTLVARGSASNPSIAYSPEVALDSFDDFNAERDRAMVAALNASPNLSPAIAGYEDLGAYGQWKAVAGYGQSWVPNEPAGWVPYRNGSWVWEAGYGWTWIGSEAWGWTPYHYGNWYYCDCGSSGWAWLPPSSATALKWSPALVGFFGFDVASAGDYNNCGGNYGYAPEGSGAPAAPANEVAQAAPSGEGAPAAPSSAEAPAAPYSSGAPAPYGMGGPGGPPESPYGYGPGYPAQYGYPYPYIGWVPIAPYEPFYPWYGFGGFGFPFATSIVNINIVNVNRVFRNFRHGGASATTIRNFRHGTVSGHTVAVTRRDIGRRFGTIHGKLPIKPTRNNLAFSHGTVHAPVNFSKAFNSPRFATHGTLGARTSSARPQRNATQAVRGGLAGHAAAHAGMGRANTPVSRVNAPAARVNGTLRGSAHVAVGHANAPVSRMSAPSTRTNAAMAHANFRETRGNASGLHGNVSEMHRNGFQARGTSFTHGNAAFARGNAAFTRENAARATRMNAPAMRQDSEMRDGSAAARQAEAPRNDFAPSSSWQRFNQGRGEARSDGSPAGSGAAMSGREMRGEVSAPGGREDRAPSDSWGRFSASRAESSGSMRGESYGSMRGESSGTRDPYAERGSFGSSGRETPSYSRGSYGSPYSRGSYPSYSRGSVGSPYSRESYPSYSRGSYPSYSHESYPSSSRGSFGSGPSYSRGYSAPPRSSGGGGGGGGGPRGGGGGPHGGGGRPPH